MSQEFEVDDEVTRKDLRSMKGKITSYNKNYYNYKVLWDDGSSSEEEENDLKVSEGELDKEFEKVREQVNAKLDQAAQLIAEAAELAKPTGEKLADYEYTSPFNTGVLEGAMDRAGWSTSSWYC